MKFKHYTLFSAFAGLLTAAFYCGVFEGVRAVSVLNNLHDAVPGLSTSVHPIAGEYRAATYLIIAVLLSAYLLLTRARSSLTAQLFRIVILALTLMQCRILVFVSDPIPGALISNSIAIRAVSKADFGLFMNCIALICLEFYLLIRVARFKAHLKT
ncbi:MAG: hypothetical protein IPN69_09200 [Acidobacteria bacterium]|nr:hypothetical protein [Acidobacteriota bacterium]